MVVALLASRALSRPALRPIRVHCSLSAPLGASFDPITTLLTAEEVAAASVSIVDTILDVAVYSLILGVVGLTIYSLYVTLDESNKAQGGWTKKEAAARKAAPTPTPAPQRLPKGARYDPATDQWTYPTEQERAAEVKASGNVVSASNRYERRAEKRVKKKRKS